MQRSRESICGFTHLFGAVLSLFGMMWLVFVYLQNPLPLIPVLIVGLSLILVYCSSTMLHLSTCSGRRFMWLNRLDHASIYALIAGTYTPIIFNALSGIWRWQVLGGLWGLAIAGMLWKML